MNAGIAATATKSSQRIRAVAINPLLAESLTAPSARPRVEVHQLKWRLGFDFRFEKQFGVQAKTSGNVFAMSITYLDLTPPPPKK